MQYREIISKVSGDIGLSETMVDKIYKAYWRAVKEHIESLPLKKELTDEEFLSLQPNVNIPSIGKLYITLKRYRNKKKQYEYILKYKNQDNVKDKED